MKHKPVLSLPRKRAYLHFDAVRTAPDNIRVDYELVIPLNEVDCRGTFDHKGTKRPKSHRMVWLDKANNYRLPLGRTNIGTNNQSYPFNVHQPEHIDLPFRDGAHVGWDAAKFTRMAVYYTFAGKHYLLVEEKVVAPLGLKAPPVVVV